MGVTIHVSIPRGDSRYSALFRAIPPRGFRGPVPEPFHKIALLFVVSIPRGDFVALYPAIVASFLVPCKPPRGFRGPVPWAAYDAQS